MRYFLVNYYQKPSGKMDEVVSVARRTRIKDLQTCSVILDFQQQQVVKCSIGEQVGIRDFKTIRDYYHKHYGKIIEDLESTNEKSHPVG